jgi:antitoxin MazE
MKQKIKKWGNSLAWRISNTIVKEYNLKENDDVKIELANNKIIIEPIKKEKSLEELLSLITPDNLHSETKTGKTVGKEIW